MEKEIKQFWQDIIYKNGKIDEKQVMKELADFYFVMQEVPKVYCAITGGSLSKINYPSEVILGEFEERFWDKEIIIDDIKEMMESAKTLKDLKEELEGYLV